MNRPALFLDRDGVVNEDRTYVHRREDFVWQDGIFELVRAALGEGYVPVIVTNQSGIGLGLYTEADYERLTGWMLERFAAERAPIARVYHCPYHPDARLPRFRAVHPWRKPAPGMLLAAIAELGLDAGASMMVGDRWSDAQAAAAAGIGTILLVGSKAEAPVLAPAGVTDVPGGALVRLPDTRAAVQWFQSRRQSQR